MLSQGEVVFFNVGIAIFACIEKNLILKDFDDTLFLIRSCTNKIDPDVLMKHLYAQKLTSEVLYKRYARALEENVKLTKANGTAIAATNAPSTITSNNSNITAAAAASTPPAIKLSPQTSSPQMIAANLDSQESKQEVVPP